MFVYHITYVVQWISQHYYYFAVTYEEKVCVSRQISQAIVFMHTATPPVVHLDIKPENVLVRLEQLNFNLRLLLLLL